MNSQSKGGTLNRFTLLAVLQAILLVSTLVLLPAQAIALEPEPTRKVADPKPAVQAAPEPGPRKTAPEKILRIFPVELVLTVGESKPVSAWVCLKDGTTRNDEDWEPKADAACALRQDVKWSLKDAGVASFVEKQGEKTRVAASTVAETKIIAKFNGLTAKIDLQIEPAAQKKQAKPAPAKPAGEPKAEKKQAKPAPQVQKKQAKPAPAKPAGEPKAEKKQAKQSVQPAADQPAAPRKQSAQPERKSIDPVDPAVEQAAQPERKTVESAVNEPIITAQAVGSGGDISIDFTAAAPLTYDHLLGGGAYNDRTVGRDKDIVESLEGGDFACFDIVTYLAHITVDAGAAADLTAQLTFGFWAEPGGQPGAGHGEPSLYQINYGPVVNGAGPGGLDSGINDNLGSNVSLVSSVLDTSGPKDEWKLTVDVTDLDAAETVVLRIDTPLTCILGSRPTGNLHGSFIEGNVDGDPIPGGAQDIPFLHVGDIALPGSKSGIKFESADAEGPYDDAEDTLIDGWTIHLYTDDDPQNGDIDAAEATPIATTTTAATTGLYSFAGLEPGSYIVCEEARTAWTQSFPASGADCSLAEDAGGSTANVEDVGYAFTITSGETHTNNDFGNWRPGTKSGIKYDDLDASGDLTAGDLPASGWVIRAYVDTDGDGVLQVGETTIADDDTTLADGSYELTLDPGKYVVCEVAQAGWTQSGPSNTKCDAIDGLAPGGHAVTMTSGGLHESNDFFNFKAGTKSGIKYDDLDASGDLTAGDLPASGWVIRAYVDTDGDGVLQVGETTIADDDTTLADGSYELTLDPGKYVVCEVAQAGWTQSGPSNTKCDAIDGLAPGGHAVTMTSGGLHESNDFFNFKAGTKSGIKYDDLDASGDLTAGDLPASGWVIRAYVDTDGDGVLQVGETTIADDDTTLADGSYTLTLDPGSYVVCEVAQAGWTQSGPSNTKCDAIDGLAPGGHAVTMTSGGLHESNDFFNYRLASKSGTKFEDLNSDSVKDAGEPGVPGVTINLILASDKSIVATDTTDANGAYSFSSLITPGIDYLVCESTVSPTWLQTYPANTVCSGVTGMEAGGWAINLSSNQQDTGNDFGNHRLLPEVTIDKTITSGPTLTGTSGTLDYEVAVANVGPIDTTYTLTDTPTFGAGITIDRIAVAAPTPPVDIDPYSSGDPIVTDEAIGVGVTHTYTVTIDFTVTGEATLSDRNCVLVAPEAGTGSLNTATVTYSGGTIEDDACAPVPGGGGGGAGGGQPPTDMLAPTASLTAATEAGGPLEGAINWAIWVLLSAALILSAGWVIRRQRFSEI